MKKKLELTTRGKYTVAIGVVLLVLLLCFMFLVTSAGKPPEDYTGIWENREEQYVYYENGSMDQDYSGAVEGIVNDTKSTYYVSNGIVDLGYTGLGASEKGWVYFNKGVLDRSFTGFARAGKSWYWVKNGAVDGTLTGAADGTINGETTWWYIEDGKTDFHYCGAAKTASGILAMKNGKLDTSYNGLKEMNGNWYYFVNGRQDSTYNGVVPNDKGVWYVKNGKVDFEFSGKVQHLGRSYPVKNGVVGNGKAVYMTFDDGPGPYTDQLLKILDHHKVKVTFFVTGFFKNNVDCIAKETKAGHTVAIHTYTHDYAKVYKSTQAYWADFEKMEQIVEQQTGKRVNAFRFPGGSSNTVSRHYSKGIMTKLTGEATKKGLVYYDWNVSSGDAGETKDSNKIYQNIVHGCSHFQNTVVLCHDTHSFTVKAMDKTIDELLKEGYVLLPIDEQTPTVHQHVQN